MALLSKIRVIEHKYCGTFTVNLIAKMVMLDKGISHFLGGMQQDSEGFQNGTQFKTYKLFLQEFSI